MSRVPLQFDQIRLNWASHRAVLQLGSLLYLRPKAFESVGTTSSRRIVRNLAALVKAFLHGMPYLFLLLLVGQWIHFGNAGVNWQFARNVAIGVTAGFAIGLLPFGLIEAVAGNLGVSLAISFTGSLAGGVIGGLFTFLTLNLEMGPYFALASGLIGGLIAGSALSIISNLSYKLTGGLALNVAVLAGGLIVSLSPSVDHGFTAAWSAAFISSYFRLHYLLAHLFIFFRRSRPELLRIHPVAWDDVCLLAFPGLDRVLVRYAEHDPAAGMREIDRLIDSYPTQRNSALRARAILVAREAARVADLAHLDAILAGLPESKKGFLQETPELRRQVQEIAALQTRIDTLNRPFLREPFAALLVKEIESFAGRIAGFRPPLSTEFRQAARRWLEIARTQHEAARAAVAREPTRQVFRAGDPVDRDKEAFVERAGILGELERQVMLATGCPGLLVYGRRRIGKSSLLKNLKGFLPPGVRIASLSMQEARAFASLASWFNLVAERIAERLPGIERADTSTPDLRDLGRLLESVETRLESENLRLLLALDEYENLDRKIGEGVFPEDFLAVLRESMQSHRRLIWTLAGSHRIDELTHAPWSSYLVSARTVEVPPFEPAETRLLLTEPLKHSSLWRAAGSEAPRFEPGFWGPGGIERIQEETGGWPHLVQLVAERVVDLVNDRGVDSADERLLDRALDRAVENGFSVFFELIEKESTLPGELAYLRRFARAETLTIPDDDAVDRSLRRRLLVVADGDRYRLRAPIMARWLRRG